MKVKQYQKFQERTADTKKQTRSLNKQLQIKANIEMQKRPYVKWRENQIADLFFSPLLLLIFNIIWIFWFLESQIC